MTHISRKGGLRDRHQRSTAVAPKVSTPEVQPLFKNSGVNITWLLALVYIRERHGRTRATMDKLNLLDDCFVSRGLLERPLPIHGNAIPTRMCNQADVQSGRQLLNFPISELT